ncbi:MAG: ATPase, T2SS/T4P/T4SS family [Oscillospiraceae bacterium]
MEVIEKIHSLLQYFPEWLRAPIIECGAELTEIRLRREKPIILMQNSDMNFIDSKGQITRVPDSSCIKLSSPETDSFFYTICRNSVHSFQEDICSGFITLSGGHRVGLCGTAVFRDGKISNIKNISGFNVRISREVIGSSEEIINKVFCAGAKSVLIAGLPSSGKTTILRDLCRILGNRYKVSVIDERSEIAAVNMGIPQNNVGLNTDVFDGYSKTEGLEMAVRVMSPDIIVFDEAGSQNEFGYMEHAMNCGIRICASIHASSLDEIKRKLPFWSRFDYIVILGKLPGQKPIIHRTDEL